MKPYLQRLVLRIDALTLRERAIVFVLAAIVLIIAVNEAVIDPLFRQQKLLSEQIRQDQAKTVELRERIRQKVQAQGTDPDAANRERLATLTQQAGKMQDTLQALHKGLVSPDKMSELLESILKRNSQLRLISLKSLPPSALGDTASTDAKKPQGSAAAETSRTDAGKTGEDAPPSPTAPVYKHGVQIVLEGGYLEMVNYMTELEALPWQLFWGHARLESEEYPKARLTLTLYTLSLDKKWLNI